MTRPLAVFGFLLREILPALRRVADALDPAGNTGQAWGPTDIVPPAWTEIEAER